MQRVYGAPLGFQRRSKNTITDPSERWDLTSRELQGTQYSVTGRALTEPELRNIDPPSTALGDELRAAITREDVLRESPPLVDVDYAALEARAMAFSTEEFLDGLFRKD